MLLRHDMWRLVTFLSHCPAYTLSIGSIISIVLWSRWWPVAAITEVVNTLRPKQNGRHFADDTFKRIFLNENVRISIKISLKFVPKGPINNNPALVQIMAWRRSDEKPLSEPMMVSLLTHICVTRPQWVNPRLGRVTHICVGKLTIIGSDNGLSPERRQAIIWTNVGILLIGPLGTNFSEILIGIQTFSFKKMHLKMSSAKWRPLCLGLNELTRPPLNFNGGLDRLGSTSLSLEQTIREEPAFLYNHFRRFFFTSQFHIPHYKLNQHWIVLIDENTLETYSVRCGCFIQGWVSSKQMSETRSYDKIHPIVRTLENQYIHNCYVTKKVPLSCHNSVCL